MVVASELQSPIIRKLSYFHKWKSMSIQINSKYLCVILLWGLFLQVINRFSQDLIVLRHSFACSTHK